MGLLLTRALLFWIHARAPGFMNLPFGNQCSNNRGTGCSTTASLWSIGWMSRNATAVDPVTAAFLYAPDLNDKHIPQRLQAYAFFLVRSIRVPYYHLLWVVGSPMRYPKAVFGTLYPEDPVSTLSPPFCNPVQCTLQTTFCQISTKSTSPRQQMGPL